MPDLVPVEGNPFAVTLTPVDEDPFAFGMNLSEGKMRDVTGHLGDNADWGKFEREARPSTNIEDDRNRIPGIIERAQRASKGFNDAVGNTLENIAQYGEPQNQFGDEAVPNPGTPVDRLPPRFRTGNTTPEDFRKVGEGFVGGMENFVTTPGSVMQPQVATGPPDAQGNPTWSEEDELRKQQREGAAAAWGPSTALGMVGGGTPFAEAGAAGVGGGRLPSPTTLEIPRRPFYSELENTVRNIDTDKATGPQWEGVLKNSGVKPDEFDWVMGDFLKSKGEGGKVVEVSVPDTARKMLGDWRTANPKQKPPDELIQAARNENEAAKAAKGKAASEAPSAPEFTKQEVLDHIAANKVDVQEVMKGGGNFTEDDLSRFEELESKVMAGQGLSDAEDFEYANLAKRSKTSESATKFGPGSGPGAPLPGGENYRELLLTLPPKETSIPNYQIVKHPDGNGFALRDDTGNYAVQGPGAVNPGQPLRWEGQAAAMHGLNYHTNPARDTTNFMSSHWDEPNVLAHVRFDDRDVGGDKTLHMAEIQSDWHQKGRKQDYANPKKDQADLQRLGMEWDKATPERQSEIVDEMNAVHDRVREGVPDAPFKNTWHELALKRMLHYAAERGYDRISWDTGATNAERYDLSKHINSIEYVSKPDGTYLFGVADKNGEGVDLPNRGRMNLQEVENIFGKEIAEKVKNNEGKKYRGHDGMTLEGLDLKVGGEGMKGFYDKMLPAAANKLVKKYGAKVEEGKVKIPPNYPDGESREVVHSIKLTPQLKDAALRHGFALFAPGGKGGAAAAALLNKKPVTLEAVEHNPFKYPQYAESYPPAGPPMLSDKATGKPILKNGVPYAMDDPEAQKLIDDKKAYWAKQLTPEQEAFSKERARITTSMQREGYTPHFDPEQRARVNPADYPTTFDMTRDAVPAKADTIAKYTEMYDTPEARKRLQAAYDEGKKIPNAARWYDVKQLQDEYVKELGEAGKEAFKKDFAEPMAATTGGATPTANYLMAHYANYLRARGEPVPPSHQLPYPIGGRYAGSNLAMYEKMVGNPEFTGFDPNNPKRHDFSHAFMGHPNKATIDEQMSDLIVPGMQIPKGDSYGVASKLVHDMAAKNNVTPQDFQDVAWAGHKKMTSGKGFDYEGPMINHINMAVERTHRLTGVPREEIVRRGVIRKEIPLYSALMLGSGGVAAELHGEKQ